MYAYFENPQQLVEAYQPGTFDILFSTNINICSMQIWIQYFSTM